ncbi:MAG: AAA family ATPase [Magnetococcus sp. YQC-5]
MEELLHESRRSRVVRVSGVDGASILKILNTVRPTPEELARFRQEHAMTVSLAEIPGVIRCQGLIRHLESLALELEDVGGVSLDRLLADAPLSLETFLDIAPRLAHILAKVHAAGVVHRDINPSNVVWNSNSGQLRLIDFGIADRLPEELAEARPPTLLEGTLAYLAPEQTGRMNRPVDSRSDLYALGATFHALLSGHPPFSSKDPLHLIADHLASRPEPLHQLHPEIPEVISRIVLKLLAKEPDERYQSAIGLAADLEQCRASWSAEQGVALFPLGHRDRVDVLRFPARLHGREKELKILSDALDQVLGGGKQLLLLTGAPGSGKTALGRELRKSVGALRGRFAGGKFDQLRRDRPMAAMMEALSNLLRQRQADPGPIFEAWRESVRQELGDSMALLTQQLPEMDLLFPNTPPLPELPPAQAAIRFRQVIIRMLRTLGDEGCPLVLLLDDLQWADLPFVELLGEMIGDSSLERLLVVGAYRDGEVPTSHPLSLAVSTWQESGLPLSRLALMPLPQQATLAFLADTLSHPKKRVLPLATLLQAISGGNPFYLRTLLMECHARGWLHHAGDGWVWDLDSIADWRVPESVVALLLERIGRLADAPRHLLAIAACLGNAFHLDILAVASGMAQQVVVDEAERLLNTGFWVPVRGERRLARWMGERHGEVIYRFAHDRVQEAALAMIPARRRAHFRLELGRRLLAAFPHSEEEDSLFIVAEQFVDLSPRRMNAGERQQVARILLAAGRRAKGAVAFAVALNYLDTGMAVLGTVGWQDDFALALAMRYEAAGCAAAVSDLQRLERLRTEVTEYCPDFKDHLPVLAHLPMLYLMRSNMEEMKQMGIAILKRLQLPIHLTPVQVARQVVETRNLLLTTFGGYKAKELAALPLTVDEDFAFFSHWLLPIFITLFFGVPSLLLHFSASIALRMPKEGLVKEAAWYYCWMGANLAGSGNESEFECGMLLGDAGHLLLETGQEHYPPGIPAMHLYNIFIRPWREPLEQCCSHIIGQYSVGIARGDLAYAAWSINAYLFYRSELGGPLVEELRICEHWLPVLEETGHAALVTMTRNITLPPMRELRGDMDAYWRIRPDLPTEISGNHDSICFYLAYSGIMNALFRNHVQALPMLRKAKEMLQEHGGDRFTSTSVVTHESLVLLALLPDSPLKDRRRMLRALTENRQRIKIWAKHNPANFLHQERLVSAAWQRAMGHPEKALPLCEEAVASIRAQSGEVWMQYEAMALELAGECFLELQCDSSARHMLRRAVRAWSRYGADAMVKEMERRHGPLVRGWNRQEKTETPVSNATNTSDQQSSTLLIDYPSLLQASQAIALEVSHAGVSERLLSLALANAGAEKARLFLSNDGDWTLVCSECGGATSQSGHFAGENTQERLLDLVRYVARSREPVLLDDASTDPQWSHLSGDPLSLLCTPLLHTGDVMGVLLLEHAHSKGVFTQERVEMVAILGAQAAISLTNARVMEELQQHLQKIRQLGCHLDQVSEAEKRRLAGEVHDELGSTLTAAKISISLLGKRQQDEADKKRCQEIYQLTDQALRSVRRISHSLRPDVLDKMGLRAALADLASSTKTHSGIDCTLDAEERDWLLDEAQRTALFRITQEALTNVVRHAGAKRVTLALRQERGEIVLDISDDGCGIAAARAQDVSSFGLAGMKERAERLGGKVSVSAPATGGTCVTARLPFKVEGATPL